MQGQVRGIVLDLPDAHLVVSVVRLDAAVGPDEVPAAVALPVSHSRKLPQKTSELILELSLLRFG